MAEGMTVEGWRQILQMATEHAVLPIVYEAVWRDESFQMVPEQMRMMCKFQVKRQVVRQAQGTMLFLDLYHRMADAGVTPLVMKGIVCREMYVTPDYRVSGDEDMLVRREEFETLDRFLLQSGFQRNEVEDMESEHEVTYMHPMNGMHLEVHLSLFPEESGSYGRLNQEFPDLFERQAVLNIQGVDVHTLDATQHMLYLLCHGLKHFLHSGFGIRQICDMVLFAETYGTKIDWAEIEDRTKRQNMYVFWMNLFDIGERYLGFSWEKAGLMKPKDEILASDAMLSDILDSGVFGKSSEERLHSANITLQASDANAQKSSGVVAALFPEYEYMRKQYSYIEGKKWLLPVAWLQRMLAYRKKMRGKDMAKPVETGKQRVALLKKYGIIEE